MSLLESVMEGTIQPDGSLVLDQKPNLPAGRVTVVLRQEALESMPREPRGVPAEQVLGIAAGAGLPPDDDTINRWIQEHRVEKYG